MVDVNWDGSPTGLNDAEARWAHAERLVTRVRTNYLNGSLRREQAIEILRSAGLTARGIDQYMEAWDLAHTVTHRTLTAAQIVAAFQAGTPMEVPARDRLINLGYSPEDADLLLARRPATRAASSRTRYLQPPGTPAQPSRQQFSLALPMPSTQVDTTAASPPSFSGGRRG